MTGIATAFTINFVLLIIWVCVLLGHIGDLEKRIGKLEKLVPKTYLRVVLSDGQIYYVPTSQCIAGLAIEEKQEERV